MPATVIVEGAAAVAAYARGRRPGKAFWSLMSVLVVIYAASVAGPPPPSVTAVAVSGLVLTPVLWFWGNRVERGPGT